MRTLGFTGAVLLFIGTFMPKVEAPLIVFWLVKVESAGIPIAIMLLSVFITVVLLALNKTEFIYFPGAISLVVVLWWLISQSLSISDLGKNANSLDLLILERVRLVKSTWAMLIAGPTMMIIAAMKTTADEKALSHSEQKSQ